MRHEISRRSLVAFMAGLIGLWRVTMPWPYSLRHILLAFLTLVGVSAKVSAQPGIPEPQQPQRVIGADAEIEAPPAYNGRWRRHIMSALIAEQFDELEETASTLRRERTRVPGGAWVLRIFYGVLDSPQQTDKDSVEHLDHLRHWVATRPQSITARVALATSLHRWAWVARGNGDAKSVSVEGWKLFGERIAEASQVLDDAKGIQPSCPQWFVEEMTVGLAQGWTPQREHEVMQRGLRLEPDYFYLETQYANFILPKWYGKPGEAATFATSEADRLGGDRGDALYFRIASVLISKHDGNFPIRELDWARIQRGQVAVASLSGDITHFHNVLAWMAYKYRDQKAAATQFALLGDDWSSNVWRDRQQFDRARDWARGRAPFSEKEELSEREQNPE